MFPGQGAQTVGMARSVFEVSAAARLVFERADDALNEHLSALIFEGSEEELRVTANAQPAILTASTAILEAVRERVPTLSRPGYTAGHSLGEYTALVASEALDFGDAVRLVRVRGAAMQAAVPLGVGGMAAVMGVDSAILDALCAEASQTEIVAPANYNAPGQIVVAGHLAAIARLAASVAASGGRVLPLNVSAPFHCKLMAPATNVVREAIERVTLRPPLVAFASNFDARATADPAEIRDLLVKQIEAPVRWQNTVKGLVDRGVDTFVEIGPGGTLARLVHRIAPSVRVLSVSDAASVEAFARFVQSGSACR
jgi:[acyl-carrier-protein] S-malonyltransferase